MRPMLAAKTPSNLSALPFPLYASTKLDGIRCIIKDGIAYSRTLKPIRNEYVQARLGDDPSLNGLDGELVVGDPNASDCMRVTNSGVMSMSKDVEFTFYVFDIWDRPGTKYTDTLAHLTDVDHPNVKVLPQELVRTVNQLEKYEASALDDGYEGVIVRRPDGLYKFGRSTNREGYLVKLKRYVQDEATILDTVPLYTNQNEATTDALGYTKRSSHQENKEALPMLGALVVEALSPYTQAPIQFNIGTGFTQAERQMYWLVRETLIGKTVSYKYFPTGSKERPRHPVFVSFRDPEDM